MQADRRLSDDVMPRVRAFVMARSNDRNDVDDIVQEAFLRFHALRHDQAVSHPLGYLYRIALNLMIDRGRRRSPLASAIEIGAVAEDILSVAPRQEEARRLADLQSAYATALSELSPRCAEVFVLRRHREMATPDVAAQLAITTRMVQKHMVTAMAHLQRRLRPFLTDDQEEMDGAGGFSVATSCQIASSSVAYA